MGTNLLSEMYNDEEIIAQLAKGEWPDEFFKLSAQKQRELRNKAKDLKPKLKRTVSSPKRMDISQWEGKLSSPQQWRNFIDYVERKGGIKEFDDKAQKKIKEIKTKLDKLEKNR